MDVADIDASLVILRGVETLRVGHCLCLDTTIGVEVRNGLDTLTSGFDGWEFLVFGVLELLDCRAATKAATARQVTCVVEEITVAFEIGYTTVVGEGIRATQGHNDALVVPGTQWIVSRRIGDVLGHATSCIKQHPLASPLHQPGTLDI